MAAGKRLPNETYMQYKARLIAKAEVLKARMYGNDFYLASKERIKKRVKAKIKRLAASQSE